MPWQIWIDVILDHDNLCYVTKQPSALQTMREMFKKNEWNLPTEINREKTEL